MFDNLNKSKMSFEKYIDMKSKLIVKSYSEKFKWIDKFLYVFSWFGNIVSIFLAFFFLQSLFYSSFKEISNSVLITIGIVFFLTLFELLKRYVFGMFSSEFIKQKFQLFNKGMVSFIIGTLLLVSGSFYLSLNGAKDFVDNQKIFEKQTKSIISSKNDSVVKFYDDKKQNYLSENDKLKKYNDDLRVKLGTASVKDMGRYQNIIDKNNKIIENNTIESSKLESIKNNKISELKSEENTVLESSLTENKSNIITFIIISALIEIIIMIGIYFDKLYDYKTIEEYEDTVVNTSEFKTWYRYNSILESIYTSTKNVGDKLPPTDSIIELLKISNIQITRTEFDRFIKLMYSLELITKDMNRRVLNKQHSVGKQLLRNYFNIK